MIAVSNKVSNNLNNAVGLSELSLKNFVTKQANCIIDLNNIKRIFE